MLAGEVQLAADDSLPLELATTQLRQWPPGGGAMVPSLSSWIAAHFQGRPDFASPAALRDVRVRQAPAYAASRASINDALYQGQLPIADSLFSPLSELGRAADAAVTKYPFDLGRSVQLMAEAGFTKRPADFYVGPSGDAFAAELRTDFADYI